MTIKSEGLRKTLKIVIPAVLIPAVLILGLTVSDTKKAAFLIIAMLLLAGVLFVAGFEQRKTGTRRLILVAVFVALSVAGRFLPLFKPVTALTIIAGIYLGKEAGFLCGSLSAVISNFYYGQGPWTPFQMVAWGLAGFLAGILADPLKRSRVFLLLFGALSGCFFSLVMDVWTVTWAASVFDWDAYLAAFLTALPFTIMYSVSNVVFLLLIAKPFGEKLERVRIKYGI